MSKAGIQTIEITKKQYEDLFLEMNPGYFDRDYVKKVPENEPVSEMLLCLRDFDRECYVKSIDDAIGCIPCYIL